MPRPSIPDPRPIPASLIGPTRVAVVWVGERYVEIDPETGKVIGKGRASPSGVEAAE